MNSVEDKENRLDVFNSILVIGGAINTMKSINELPTKLMNCLNLAWKPKYSIEDMKLYKDGVKMGEVIGIKGKAVKVKIESDNPYLNGQIQVFQYFPS